MALHESQQRAEVERIMADPDEMARLRLKLSDVSSLMSYFDEHIAKASNKEDDVKGAFWEGVFGCEVIDSEEALLACMVYVDLNPIRAMMAESIPDSEFTGAADRFHELKQAVESQEFGANVSDAKSWPEVDWQFSDA